MKLMYYEWLKLIRQKAFLLLLIFVLICDVFFIFLQKNMEETDIVNAQFSVQMQEKLYMLSEDERLPWLQKESSFYDKAVRYYQEEIYGVHETSLSNEELIRYEKENKYGLMLYQNIILDTLQYYEQVNHYEEYILQGKN